MVTTFSTFPIVLVGEWLLPSYVDLYCLILEGGKTNDVHLMIIQPLNPMGIL